MVDSTQNQRPLVGPLKITGTVGSTLRFNDAASGAIQFPDKKWRKEQRYIASQFQPGAVGWLSLLRPRRVFSALWLASSQDRSPAVMPQTGNRCPTACADGLAADCLKRSSAQPSYLHP